ncbi:response regulator transcription factor [Fodinicola feengrottensis]|uniref:Response regulator transcription factor n=1 Tax=Fodinicola feengrottensis TaxID=435914 RepID=A0ABN2G0V5_9ACTN|nr:response regulator transcription factor [Fodinicola feengrottensis]
MRVMVVEDDDGVADALTDGLRGFAIRTLRVRRADDMLRDHTMADLVLLDLGLPDLDGLDGLRKLRRISNVPVIVLTARNDDRSVIRGLRLGADDYLVKPVGLTVLLARIEAVRRRGRTVRADAHAVVQIADIHIELDSRQVIVGGTPVALTPIEFGILASLARRVGEAVSRQLVMDEVWGDAYLAVSRSLDVHIGALRGKLGRPGLITTIRGFGFRLEESPGCAVDSSPRS